ncbi:hypothetical protein GGF43_000312 [Coemansia sp. RSA 2618]|nr:hypothetical protein GGF43_000312 [Coemansia sp. RSA 2618]
MPRPARKPPAKATSSTRASLQRKQKTTEKGSTKKEEEELPGQENSTVNVSPAQRSIDVRSSPRSPLAGSPRYGRRSAAHRRVSFTPVSPSRTRRVSGGPEFDDLIDGLSPIKRGGPAAAEMELELSDQGEADALPMPQDVLAEKEEEEEEERRPRTRARAAAVSTSSTPTGDVEGPGSKDGEGESSAGSESDDFDIDALVVKSSKRPISRRAAVAVQSEGPATGIPRRHRTQKPETPAKAKGRAPQKTRKYVEAESSDSDVEPKNKKKKVATRGRSSKPSKPSKPGSKKADDIWAADANFARHFDDIDGFELAEEQV